ncbi:hypothetical protein [Halobaculum sp. D14]|uniref:hypothetical protein n=1 Tax=Halobaculum sp. D14 TaxID=3421642 RepID=UPI003EBF3127
MSRPGPLEYVKTIATNRLDDHPAWPVSQFKLECEVAGVYQNTTGNALIELKRAGEIEEKSVQVDGDTRKYFARSKRHEPEDSIVEATKRFEAFLTRSGYYANLIAYVALCKIYDEIGQHITGFDVLPEGPHRYILNNPGREPDGVLLLPDERVPVEVYNGGDYLGTNTRKHQQLEDLSSDPDNGIPTNPMLINRLSDDEMRAAVRSMNGIVIDTNVMVACNNEKPEINEVLDTLHLTPRFSFLPEVETTDGDVLDGADYDELSLSTGDVDTLRPPSKMLESADILPDQYIKRIRGGVQLQYVNSIYREGHGRMKQDACLVLQAIYNILLREGGLTRSTALNRGWDRTIEHYNRLKSAQQRKESILDHTRDLLNRLQDEHIITQRSGKIYARQAEHPQQHLTF